MFSKNKTTCNYILFPDFFTRYNLPKAIFKNIESNNFSKFNCPSVNVVNDKVFTVNSFINLEVEYGLKNNEPYYNYLLDSKTSVITEDLHNIIKNMLQISYNNNVINLQLLSPYTFITDDKELEIITTTPNMKNENSIYVSGGLKPYSWIRNLNSAWTLKNYKKPGKLYFNLKDPFINFIFNKNVNLEYMEPNDKILNYIDQNLHIVNIRKNLKDIYKTTLNRRPKKLL